MRRLGLLSDDGICGISTRFVFPVFSALFLFSSFYSGFAESPRSLRSRISGNEIAEDRLDLDGR